MALIGLQQKMVPEIIVASRKVFVEDTKSIQKNLNCAYDELYNYLCKHHVYIDYCKAMFCNINNTQLSYQYIEAVLFLKSELQGNDSIQIYKLPPTRVVSALHVGDFASIKETHIAFTKWIKEKDLTITGAYRELYHKHDLRDLTDTITEIQYPIAQKRNDGSREVASDR